MHHIIYTTTASCSQWRPVTNGMLYKSNTTGALKHIRTPLGTHRGWQWLQDVAVVSCLSHRHNYSICSCVVNWRRYCTCTWRGVICISNISCITHIYNACTTNNPGHVYGIAQGSTHTTQFQTGSCRQESLKLKIGWCQLFQATWPSSVQRTLSQSHFSVSSPIHTLHTAITHVLNILKLQNSNGN